MNEKLATEVGNTRPGCFVRLSLALEDPEGTAGTGWVFDEEA
jgi:hypothetical protein